MPGPWSPEQRAKHASTTARKRAEARPRGPTLGQRCDLCGVSGSEVRVLRFSLTIGTSVGGRETTRGAGAIELCERDWRTTAARRRRGRVAA